jgi:hypothetical protein
VSARENEQAQLDTLTLACTKIEALLVAEMGRRLWRPRRYWMISNSTYWSIYSFPEIME